MASNPLRNSFLALRYPNWQRPYQVALYELDPKKLAMCIEEAEAAIYERLQQLSEMSHGQDGQRERHAIKAAISALRILKRDSLNFPDWESNSLRDRQAF
jgi:hypothetical protein